MQNNKLGKVAVKSAKRKPTKKNWAFDLATTMGFGEVQPICARHLIADSEASYSFDSAVWLSAMVKPTFARLGIECTSMFVPTRDVFPCVDEYFAQKPVSYGGTNYVPLRRPHAPLALISAACLVGSEICIYKSLETPTGLTAMASSSNDYSDMMVDFQDEYGNGWFSTGGTTPFRGDLVSSVLPLKVLLNTGTTYNGKWWFENLKLPVKNPNGMALSLDSSNKVPYVAPNEADYLITKQVGNNGNWYTIAIKLSGFGKRVRKMILGAGLQIKLNATFDVKIEKLMSCWKVWFDSYFVQHWYNYNQTNLSNLISAMLLVGGTEGFDASSSAGSCVQWLCRFLGDLGSCWYTDQTDYVSAHVLNLGDATSTGNIPSPYSFPTGTDGHNVTNSGLHTSAPANMMESAVNASPHGTINNLVHSQLDSELLKKWYKIVNVKSVIGQSIEKELILRGYQSYVDECKSNYIGSQHIPIYLTDCVARADTYNDATDQGMLLGERGGQGVGGNKQKDIRTLRYKTAEDGYWVTIACVAPKSGYCQMISGDSMAWDHDHDYDAEFDGVGMELTNAATIFGVENWTTSSAAAGSMNRAFGYIPRYSSLKIQPNLMNGDFSLRSKQKVYRPFTLDKIVDIHEKEAYNGMLASDESFYSYGLAGAFLEPGSIPDASPVLWRYPTRYGWIGQLHRMFAFTGKSDENPYLWNATSSAEWEVFAPYTDNFVLQQIVNFHGRDRMLPISDSFETREDGNEGATDISVAKV